MLMTKRDQSSCAAWRDRRRWRVLGHAALVVMIAASAGCSGTGRVARENDRLRSDHMALERQIDSLKESLGLRLAQIKQLNQRPGLSARDSGAELVQLVDLRFDRYSGPIDTNSDGIDDTLRVYVRPVDQQGRFMLAVGEAKLQAVAIVAGRKPRIIVVHVFTAADFDKAYRSGITGTHYTLEQPLPARLPSDITTLTVVLAFTDAATGAKLRHEQAYPIRTSAAQRQ